IDMPPDLVNADAGCMLSCANGMATNCCGGKMTFACGNGGCDVVTNACAVPGCPNPLDVSKGGTFMTSTSGGRDFLSGSCGGVAGAEAVFSFTLAQFANVQLDVMAMAAPVLYTRQKCGAGPELYAGGLCAAKAFTLGCTSAMNP